MRRYKKNLKHKVGFQEFFHLRGKCLERAVIIKDADFGYLTLWLVNIFYHFLNLGCKSRGRISLSRRVTALTEQIGLWGYGIRGL